ncbi:MAG TPA: ABC transporter permease, partial [Blastocatellia bacterium]|nr:ABC transporter permease [Blastocatellia bacterium]
FAALAIITLALGIGANTVIFSGVYALLLQALPYPAAERIVVVSQTDSQGTESGISYPDFVDWSRQNTVFEQMALSRPMTVNLESGRTTDPRSAVRVNGASVSKEFFPLLGGRVRLGRTFLPEDAQPGSAKTIILSYGLWQYRFGGDEQIGGTQVRLNQELFTVIGVAPAAFQYPFRAAFWIPLEPNERPELLHDGAARFYQPVAVLKPGVTSDLAARELSMLAQRSAQRDSGPHAEQKPRVTYLRESNPALAKYRTPLLIMQFAVIFVLLIASANLANMLLARNTEREREFTIRLALGAGPARIVRQLLVESLLIGLLGSLLGMVFAYWGMNGLRAILPARALTANTEVVELNAPVLFITLLLSLLTSLGFGLVPALLASRQDLNEGLKSRAANTTFDPRRRRLSKILVSAEVALAVVLLTASGLMIRTFLNLTSEDPGFVPANLIAATLSLPQSPAADYDQLSSYVDQATARLKALPGVEAVSGVAYLPLIGYNPGIDFTIAGRAAGPSETALRADFQPILPDYFEAMKIPLRRGQSFAATDLKPAPDRVIINQALADKFWPGQDPIGGQIQLQSKDAPPNPLTVIGIVGNVKQFGLHSEPRPEIYLPAYRHSMTLIVRTRVDPGPLFTRVRETLDRLDQNRSALNLRTMDQVLVDSIATRKAFAMLLGMMAAIALLLAAMGIYGVISYLSAQRTREIGIRLTLGASSREILRLIVGQGMRPVLHGLALGLVAAAVLTQVMKSVLFGVSHTDPLTLILTLTLLLTVSVLACLLPARRALKVDPVATLRSE